MFGGISNWLKKRVDDVEGVFGRPNAAQTFRTNVSKAPPAQTISKPRPQVRPVQQRDFGADLNKVTQPKFNLNQSLQNNGVVTPQQPKPVQVAPQPKTTQQLASETYGSGIKGTLNRARDLFDPNTEADQIKRRAQSGLSESYQQQQDRLTREAQNDPRKRGAAEQISGNALGGFSEFSKAIPQAIKMQGAIGQTKAGKVLTYLNPVTAAPALGDELWKRATGQDTAKKRNEFLYKAGSATEKHLDNKIQQSGLGNKQSDNRIIAGVSRAGGQLLAQTAAAAATGGSTIPAAAMGVQTASSEYDNARQAGKDNDQAVATGLAQGVVAGALEKVGFDKLGGGKSVLANVARGILSEGAQEGTQQLAQNLVAKGMYDPSRSVTEGVAESALIGGLTGGAAGPLMSDYKGSGGGLLDAVRGRTPLNQGGFIEVGRTPKNIHPEDQNVMSDFIDTQRGVYNPDPQTRHNLEVDAARIAERYGLEMPNTATKLANVFDRRLQQDGFAQPSLIERAKSKLIPLNEGGYVQAPIGDSSLDSLVNNFKDIDANVFEGDREITLSKIVVPKDKRGGGLGTAFMNELTDYADRVGKRVVLTPSKDYGGSVPRLKDFYKRSGFVENTGRNKDFSTRERMYRDPQSQKNTLKNKLGLKPLNEKGFVQVPGGKDVNPLESLKQEAKRFGYDKGYTEEGQIANTIDELMKEQNAVREVGIPLYDKYKSKLDGTKTVTDMMTPAELEAYRVAETKSERASKLLKDYFDYKKAQNQAVEANQPKVPRGNLQRALQPDTAYADTIRGLASQDSSSVLERMQNQTQSPETPQQLAPRFQDLQQASSDSVGSSEQTKSREMQRLQQRKALDTEGYPRSPYNSTVPQSLNEFDRAIGGDGNIEQEVTNNAAAYRTLGKDAKALVESINGDNDITKSARKAVEDGSEMHYFARKDTNGRSVGVERFDPKSMKIEAGFVTDNNGNVLGNHIKVDDTGIQVNVGGDLINLDSVIGNPLDWDGHYKMSETMERNIKNNAPNEEIARKTQRFLIAAKTKREAAFREELQNTRKQFSDLDRATMAVKPRGVDDKTYRADLMDYFENNLSDADIRGKYGEAAFIQANAAKSATRAMYDQILDRVNTEFGKFGEAQVERRKDYITHISELNGRPTFAGEMFGRLQNSILGESEGKTRGSVPSDIAGRTENFEPRKRWNQFFQARKGGDYTKDPFKAIDAYLEPSLYNIHMTEPAVRARAIESAFRAAEQVKNTTKEGLNKQLTDSLAKYDHKGNGKLVKGFQEYANALAGKTQHWDRAITDSSKGAETALRGWQGLQGIAGRATILGNLNSVVSQTLGLPSALADAGPQHYVQGIAAVLSGDKSIDQSPFIKARGTDVASRFRTNRQKIYDTGGKPLQMVEMAMVKQTWHAEHAKVKSEGFKGMDAVLEADRRTERIVAGRGIADKPEMYRSTALNGLLQYTLEAEAQYKNFTQDLSASQKATFMVAALAMNSLSELVTGNTPLPDFLGAAIDSLGDIFGDEKEGIEKVTSPLQRYLSESVSFNPVASAAANLLPKDQRRTLFGDDSDFGRYDGSSAPVQVVQNVIRGARKAASGELTGARNDILKTLPFGNQVRKSLTGIEANASGTAVDSKGNPTFETGGNIGSQLRNVLFGPNSTKEAREHYDTPTSSRTGSKTDLLSTSDLLKEQFSSKEQREWLKTSETEKRELAKTDPEAKKWYEQYKSTKRVNQPGGDYPDDISDESRRILDGDMRRSKAQKDKLSRSQNDYDYKLAFAKYEVDDKAGNISKSQRVNRLQSLKKAEVGSKFDKDTREIYNTLSKAEIKNLVENDENGKEIYEKLLAYGDSLVDAKLLKKNKLRTGSKGSGGRKGRKGGAKLAYKSTDTSSISKKLQQLAGVKSSGGGSVSTPKKHTPRLKGVRSV